MFPTARTILLTPSDVAPVNENLPQIVSDAYQRWEERTDIDPDAPSTEADREAMEQQLKDSMPSPENYPQNNDGESLPDKEDSAPDSDSSSDGGSESGNEGDDHSGDDGGGG
jgi:hypothetical protein